MRGPRKRFSRSALAQILVVWGCTAWLTACGQDPTRAVERPAAPVVVATAIARDVPVYLEAIGKTVAREVVSIQPQITGPIAAIHFTDGADLKAGDALFTIDPRPFEAALQQAEANVGRDQAQIRPAEATLAQSTAAERQAQANLARDVAQLENANVQERRYHNLVSEQVISRELYDQVHTTALALRATVEADRAAIANAEAAVTAARAALETARAALLADQAVVETARIQLGYTQIRSPILGRAGQRLVDVGNVVTANTSVLLSIQRLDPIYADFTLPEADLGPIQRHMAQGTLMVEVRLPEAPDGPVAGQLTFLDNAVQDATATVKLRATIPNGERRFWPGRFVKIRLILRRQPGAVLVPAAAPQQSAKGPFVYVVKEDATAELRVVALGQRQGELVVIAQGVRPGERVVVTGQLGVTPGGKVRIDGQGSAAEVPGGNGGGKP